MSFRSRLRVFFTIIVVVPMAAVALVLFSLTEDSETGKADARLAGGLRTAFALYDEAGENARRQLDRVVNDRELQRALTAGRTAAIERRLRELVAANLGIRSAAFHDPGGELVARAGEAEAVSSATAAPTTRAGERLGTIAVSVTPAQEFATDVARFTGLEVRLFRDGRRLASTLERDDGSQGSGDVEIGGREFRGRFQEMRDAVGAPLRIGLYEDADEVRSSINEGRLAIGGILALFLVLALGSSVFVVRSLHGQVEQFLAAARRLGRGDFTIRVPATGRDEFAQLGREFNRMSEQLASQIDEVERKRRQLEETIRRVGEAFATGLDRQGVVDLAVRTSMEACSAQAGRAVALDANKMPSAAVGTDDARLAAALEAAERKAFTVDAEIGAELIATLEPSLDAPEMRRLSAVEVDGAHALALPLRAHLGAGSDVQYVGVVAIAREGEPFSDAEHDLFGYLAGQAVVSIENVDLHETVQRQAVTDELTSLYNVRHFHDWLDVEIERSKRFATPIGLVMLDIDDFKLVNDTYGHQQGDLVLMEVARAVRELSRDVDEPARYGGEEIAVVLPQTDIEGTALAAERVRTAIEALEIPRVDGKGVLRVTASCGVAALPGSAPAKDSLIAAADAALYRAKRAGKNRVERADAAAARS
ncbi:MAG: diguanylate cyclase [Thermoleophilaceae bacterium]